MNDHIHYGSCLTAKLGIFLCLSINYVALLCRVLQDHALTWFLLACTTGLLELTGLHKLTQIKTVKYSLNNTKRMKKKQRYFTQLHTLIWIFKRYWCSRWFWQKFCHKKSTHLDHSYLKYALVQPSDGNLVSLIYAYYQQGMSDRRSFDCQSRSWSFF